MVRVSKRDADASRDASKGERLGSPREPGATGRNVSGAGINVKLQLDFPTGSRIGPGKIRLLELIESEGSLSRAANTLGMSYRRAWLFAQQINSAFDEAAVATPAHGRGGTAAKLTDFGRELIRRYRCIECATEFHGGEDLCWFLRHKRD